MFKKIIPDIRYRFRNQWQKFLDQNRKKSHNLVSSRPFWIRIKQFRQQKKGSTIPKLVKDGKEYEKNIDKANLFAEILKNTFSGSKNLAFNQKFKEQIEKEVNNRDKKTAEISCFTMEELVSSIKSIRANSAPGPDKITNHMIKNFPASFLEVVLELFNLTLKCEKIPESWKIASIQMIPKKNVSSNPTDYRPISLTSCLGKLCEKIIGNRMRSFLEENKKLSKRQSGFRKKRGTWDNLVYLAQKIAENINRGQKLLCIFFDIEKAFDNVWHKGLIWKLMNMKVPTYLVNWIESFLFGRSFYVKLNESQSITYEIEAGVPQGASISPILFMIFINDIPLEDNEGISESLLFADDLVTMFDLEGSNEVVQKRIDNYMEKMEEWFRQWRLCPSIGKCCYTVFSGNGHEEKTIKPKLFGKELKKDDNPKLLGIVFDKTLSFGAQVKAIKEKVSNRINIIKILSHRSWFIDKKTLTNLYLSLVRSVIDYSFVVISRLSTKNLKSLEAAQNVSLRCIHHLPFRSHGADVRKIAGLNSIKERLERLGKNYLVKCKESSNPLIGDLCKKYNYTSSFYNNLTKATPLCIISNRAVNG